MNFRAVSGPHPSILSPSRLRRGARGLRGEGVQFNQEKGAAELQSRAVVAISCEGCSSDMRFLAVSYRCK